ncbi:LPS translocon maturation chaperone LptM [Dokdonella soli]|uniref:Sugar transporter n=1 Tax=Dokdonella soli TaxID=529810 RepID=A0ABN1IEA6_9GAMM
MSRHRPFHRIAVLVLVALLLAACGNKGPLVKPTPKPASTPAQAPVAQPAQAPEAADH